MMKFYFMYKTLDDNGNIIALGFSRDYDDKEEMWENLEFQRMCGYECRPFVVEGIF